MALDLSVIREALAAAIQSGIERPVNVYPYMPADPAWPCIVVTPADDYLSPHESYGMRQTVAVNFDVLIGGTGRPEDALRLLDELLSMGDAQGSSVIDAIEVASGNPGLNEALGGLVQNMYCESAEILTPGEQNAQVFAASIRVRVLAQR
jgi:hypothetical protein